MNEENLFNKSVELIKCIMFYEEYDIETVKANIQKEYSHYPALVVTTIKVIECIDKELKQFRDLFITEEGKTNDKRR